MAEEDERCGQMGTTMIGGALLRNHARALALD